MVLLFYNGYSTGCLGDTWSTPTSTTSRASTNNASCRSTAMFDIAQAAAGSTGSFTSTVSETANAGVVTIALKTAVSVDTTGNNGFSYNYFYPMGNFTLANTSNLFVNWGTTNTGNCATLANNTFVGSLGAGTYTGQNYQISSGVNGSTTYYFCYYAFDTVTSTTYYSPNAEIQSVTTSAPPSPALAYPQASAIDDSSARVGAGVITYGFATTAIIRYGTSNVACSSLPSTTTSFNIQVDNGNYFANATRLTGLSPSTTYYWCMQANNTNGSGPGYSAVSSFTTTTAAAVGCDLLPNSTLASAANKTTLLGYLGNPKFQGTLLYRASSNGWAPANFHTAVDSQGENIVMFKNSGTNTVFGGYMPRTWDSSGAWYTGSNAFMFNLSDGYKLNQLYSAYMGYSAPSYGPSFGANYNLYDATNPMNAVSAGQTNSGTYYQAPSTQGAYNFLNDGGAAAFTPSEIEVYKLSICTSAAPSVSSPTSTNITPSGATIGGNVTSGGTQPITARGVCYAATSTDANPRIGDPGVTCLAEGGTTTGVFTVNIGSLLANTAYSFNAYATNSVGTNYSLSTFSTLNPAPTTVNTTSVGSTASYYAQLNGSANPNGYQTYAHFRLYTANPGTCSGDSGGIRFPAGTGSFPDINLGTGISVVPFSYTIPLNSGTFLVPNTTYYYCAYAVNTFNSTNYTTGASGVQNFTTPDGPASPCDPPSTGNLTIPSGAACNFNGFFNGVDSGSGTRNTATMSLTAGVQLTVAAGQTIGVGSIGLAKGSTLVLAKGSSIAFGGIYVHDADRDGYLDDATQYVGSTPSAATEFIRRSLINNAFNYAWKIASSGAMYDCNKNSQYAWRMIPNLVKDADHDGYKTSTAAGPQCVGSTFIFNGRTYYNDGSGPN